MAHTSHEQATVCAFTPSKDLQKNLSTAQLDEAGGGLTLSIISRRDWSAQHYGNLLPRRHGTTITLHGFGTRAYVEILGSGSVIAWMQDRNATCDLVAGLLREVRPVLRKVLTGLS